MHSTLQELVMSGFALLINLIVLITLALLLTPIFIIRQIVTLTAKCFKPAFGEMLSGLSALHASWGVHSQPKGNNRQCSITMSFVIANSEINLNKIEDIGQMLLSDDKFAKAKMILVKWMGFYFWKYPSSFDLKSHLILHEAPITQADFENLTENIINNEPYDKEKPLWEINLFSQYLPSSPSENINCEQSESYCAVALKFHHSLADWFSSIRLLNAINGCLVLRKLIAPSEANNVNPINKPPPPRNFNSNYKMLLFGLKVLLFGTFEFFKECIKAANTTIGKVTNILPLKEQHSFQIRVPHEYVKTIAQKNQVSTPVLTFAAFSGALRRLMVDLDVHPLPEKLSVSMPVPLPWARPQHLGNNYSVIFVYAPISEEDPLKRLSLVAKEFEAMKTSIRPLAFHVHYEILGSLFYWILEPFSVYGLGATNCSLAPGPKDLGESLGLDIKQFRIIGGMPFGDLVMLGFYSGNVSGQAELRICGDTALFKNSSGKQFIETLLEGLEAYNHEMKYIHIE